MQRASYCQHRDNVSKILWEVFPSKSSLLFSFATLQNRWRMTIALGLDIFVRDLEDGIFRNFKFLTTMNPREKLVPRYETDGTTRTKLLVKYAQSEINVF